MSGFLGLIGVLLLLFFILVVPALCVVNLVLLYRLSGKVKRLEQGAGPCPQTGASPPAPSPAPVKEAGRIPGYTDYLSPSAGHDAAEPAAAVATGWHLFTETGLRGPLTTLQVRELCGGGVIKKSMRIRCGVSGAWQAIEDLGEFQDAFPELVSPAAPTPESAPAPPPLPPPVPEPEVTALPEPAPASVAVESEVAPEPPAATPVKEKDDLETKIGAVWFLRIGLAALVIAFAYLGTYIHPHLQPWHKVVASYIASGVLFGIGWFFSKKLKLFARPVMAGALALMFFISFASHGVAGMACVSLWASLALMSLTIAAVFYCAERWMSETTAGLAILLGHIAAYIAGGDADTFSLTAIIFLCIATLALYLRNNWLLLSLFSLVAAHASHICWALQEHPVTSVEFRFWVNFLFLGGYYLVFLAIGLINIRRCGRDNPPELTPVEQLSGRLLGPAAFIFYVTLAAALFYLTEIYWLEIHYFLFPLAALQLAVMHYHRVNRNIDHLIYAVASLVLLTLGFFSWLDGLALNMVLAAEALLLLIMARRLQLWYLNPLAQLVLFINFLHFWFSDARNIVTWPGYLGSLVVAAVYFVKARLEESWQPLAGRASMFKNRAIDLAKEFMDVVTLPLGYCHAVAGALLLCYQATLFFALPDDAIAVMALVVALALLTLALKSGVMLLAAGLLQVVLTIMLIMQPHKMSGLIREFTRATMPDSIWLQDQIIILSVILAAWLALVLARRSRRLLYFILGLMLAAVAFPAAVFMYGKGAPLAPFFPLAAIVPLVLWYEADKGRKQFNDPQLTPRQIVLPALERVSNAAMPWAGWLLAVFAAVLTNRLITVTVAGNAATVLALSLVTCAIAAVAVWRKNSAYLAGLLAHAVLLFGQLFHYLSTLPAGPAAAGLTPENLLPWWTVTSVIVVGVVLLRVGGLRRQLPFIIAAFAVAAFAMCAVAYVLVQEWLPWSPLYLWIITCAGLLYIAEHHRNSFADKARLADWPRQFGLSLVAATATVRGIVLAVFGTLLLIAITAQALAEPNLLCWMLLAYALGLYILVGLWRSPVFGIAYWLNLIAFYLFYHHDIGITEGAVAHWGLTLTGIVLTLVFAGVLEWFINRRERMSGKVKIVIAAAVGLSYLLSLQLLTGFIRVLGEEYFANVLLLLPAQLGIGLVLISIAILLRLAYLEIATLLYAAWTIVNFFWLPYSDYCRAQFLATSYITDLLAPGLLMLFILLPLERLIILQDKRTLARITDKLQPLLGNIFVMVICLTVLYVPLVSEELRGYWTTLSWTIAALVLMVFGFLWKNVNYRRSALLVFCFALVRILVIDMARLELFYRMIAFFGMGICLIAVSFLYNRYREKLKEWL